MIQLKIISFTQTVSIEYNLVAMFDVFHKVGSEFLNLKLDWSFCLKNFYLRSPMVCNNSLIVENDISVKKLQSMILVDFFSKCRH